MCCGGNTIAYARRDRHLPCAWRARSELRVPCFPCFD
jgi:hypothetical protein